MKTVTLDARVVTKLFTLSHSKTSFNTRLRECASNGDQVMEVSNECGAQMHVVAPKMSHL